MKASPESHGVAEPLDAFEPLDTCHREALRMLGELATLATRVEAVGIDSRVRDAARTVDHYFSVEL